MGERDPFEAMYEYGAGSAEAFKRGAAAAFGIMGMAQAIGNKGFEPGDEVEVTQGLSAGETGTVLLFDHVGEAPVVRIYRVEVHGKRIRAIREDFMKLRVPKEPLKRPACARCRSVEPRPGLAHVYTRQLDCVPEEDVGKVAQVHPKAQLSVKLHNKENKT